MRRNFLAILAAVVLGSLAPGRAHALPSGGSADRIAVGQDDEGRLQDTIQPNLSLTRLAYDKLGRVSEVLVGVDGAGSPSKVASYFYDGATTSALVVGNGNLSCVPKSSCTKVLT